MEPTPQLIYWDERISCFAQDDIFYGRWIEAPTVLDMDRMEAAAVEYEASVEGGVGLCNIVVGGTPSFSNAVRKRTAQLSGNPDVFCRFRAHLVLLPGMRGLAVSTFINTFLLVGGTPRPSRGFTDLVAASTWILPHVGAPGWTAASIGQSIGAVRDVEPG